MLGDNSIVEPPDPIPNSEVKRNRADGSVETGRATGREREETSVGADSLKKKKSKMDNHH